MNSHRLRSAARSLLNVNKGRASYKTIRKRTVEGAEIDGIHLCQLIAAMVIACIGLNIDSTEAVVGAMLICPIMGSALAISYAIASLDFKLLREASLGLVVQVMVCLVTSSVYFMLTPLTHATSEIMANSSATVWNVFIAFVGGFAGALGYSRRQEPSTLIAGVAVATALMPPLCTTGYGLAMRDFVLAASAFYNFLINVFFITFSAELVLVWLRVPMKTDLDGDGVTTQEEELSAERRSRKIRIELLIASFLLALPCLHFTGVKINDSVQQNGTVFETVDTYGTELVTRELKAVCPELVSYRIGTEESFDEGNDQIATHVVATVETSTDIGETREKQLKQLITLNVPAIDNVKFVVSSSSNT